MEADQQNYVDILEKELGANWSSIRKAKESTSDTIKGLKEIFSTVPKPEDFNNNDISLVVFGSLARKEYTSGSDIDWTFLVDGRANSEYLDIMLNFKNELSEKLKGPGRGDTFGGLAFSHDIIHNIGGNEDTNKNTTQRILLLLESLSISNHDLEDSAHERVIKGILNRYISEDRKAKGGEIKVPRFLLNDIVRYWRTIAVDFGHKRRQRQWEGAALRNIKLRMSRKLIYVSGLVACFACEINNSRISYKHNEDMIEYLYRLLLLSPLEILSVIFLSYDQLYLPAKVVMDNYDKFLELLDDKEKRERLEKLKPHEVETDEVYQNSRIICECFQKGLNDIFLSENKTNFFSLIKKYGVF